MLSWLHFGDPHITAGDQRNYQDLQALVAEANRHLGDVDFAVLPGSRRWKRLDTCVIGAWPEKGILGTQLGPNKNGRKW